MTTGCIGLSDLFCDQRLDSYKRFTLIGYAETITQHCSDLLSQGACRDYAVTAMCQTGRQLLAAGRFHGYLEIIDSYIYSDYSPSVLDSGYISSNCMKTCALCQSVV